MKTFGRTFFPFSEVWLKLENNSFAEKKRKMLIFKIFFLNNKINPYCIFSCFWSLGLISAQNKALTIIKKTKICIFPLSPFLAPLPELPPPPLVSPLHSLQPSSITMQNLMARILYLLTVYNGRQTTGGTKIWGKKGTERKRDTNHHPSWCYLT